MPAHLIAEEGPLRGLVLNLEEGEDWIVGRDPDEADFVIEDSTVSRKHLRLTKTSEGIYLKNLSRINPTVVNGEIPVDRLLLKEGDRIQVGNTTFLFSEEAIPDLETPPPKKSKSKKKASYDDIFGKLDELPPMEEKPPEPIEQIEEEPNAYNTIFEDIHSEPEVPFNLIPESPLILKVLSGPNAGAEIGLEKGRSYLIGKDPNLCDIVFQDLSVSKNHARLTVSPDGILEIEDLGSKNGTVVNGQPILERKIITPQDMISLGTTMFLIIDREAPQETIYSPLIPHYEERRSEENPFASEEAEKELEEIEKKTDWKKAKIPPKYLIIGGAFAAVFLVIFLSFFSLFKSERIEIVKKEPVEEIRDALQKFPAVQFSFNPASGKLFLVGHVASGINYQEMQYNIEQIPFITSVENTVIIDELVSKTMNDILSSNSAWRSVTISSPMPGKFTVNGSIATSAEAQKLGDYLTMNFPYLDKLDNQVAVEEILNAQIGAILASRGFSALTFQLTQGELVLSGPYSEEREKEYQTLLKELNQLNGVHSVKNFAVASHPNQAGMDISQQYTVTGSSSFDGRGYSVILNGKIYTLGDLVDGMKLISIESNTILLEKDGLNYKINYTR